MTKDRFHLKVKRTDYYKPMCRALEAFGIDDWSIESGLKHGKLRFTYLGEDHAIPLPGDPASKPGGEAANYVPAMIRKRVREARQRKGLPPLSHH